MISHAFERDIEFEAIDLSVLRNDACQQALQRRKVPIASA
jgi:hypothetical protein